MKDPAALVYIDKFYTATAGMRACFRAWYFDLILYQFDKGPIPNDLDTLAGICRVRPSEYDLFNQMVNQVVNHKFNQTDDGNLINDFAAEIISKRNTFKEKRTFSSNIAVVIKKAKKLKGVNNQVIDALKAELYQMSLDEVIKHKNNQVLNQVVNRLVNLYINEDVNEDIHDINKGGVGENEKTAYEVLKAASPGWVEAFEMKNRKQLNGEWSTFIANYEYAVAKDGIDLGNLKLLKLRAEKQFANWDKSPKHKPKEVKTLTNKR